MQFRFRRQNIAPLAQHKSRRRPLKGRRASFDCLEDRRLLSASALTAAAPQFAVSAPGIVGTSAPRDVAMDSHGNAAAVWMSPDANGDGNATLNYQYYSNSSGALTPTFGGTVATGVPRSSAGTWVGYPPVIEVAMAPGSATSPGEFALVWETSAET